MFSRLKEEIQKEYPTLTPESKFKFSCDKGLSCFTQCCGDVNVFLTPYDVLRMKTALQIDSGEFLEQYTKALHTSDQKLPLVLLNMRDDDRKSCPFVTPDGCSIYEDRPWSCRMFPLGMASSKTGDGDDGEEFCFILEKEFPCMGFKEDKEQTVAEWWKDQEIDLYNEKNKPFREISLHRRFREGKGLGPSKLQMFYLTCYDLDRFREFLFGSTFFQRFDLDEEVIKRIEANDEELLNFGFDWLRFSLFGEGTIKVKGEVAEGLSKQLGLDPVG